MAPTHHRSSDHCAICYESKVLAPLKTVRYTKHTCTMAELQIVAICTRNLPKFGAILEHITTLAEVPTLSMYLYLTSRWDSGMKVGGI